MIKKSSLRNLGWKSLVILLLSPLISIIVVFMTPSTGSEFVSGYNRLAAGLVTQAILIFVAFIFGILGLLNSNRYKIQAAITVVIILIIIFLISFGFIR